jgi:hypothetical protein
MYKLNRSFICKNYCEKICKPHLRHIQQEGKTSEAQEKIREWSNCPFWARIKKISTFTFWGAWSFFLVHIRFTPSERPKAFKTKLLRSWTMKVGP